MKYSNRQHIILALIKHSGEVPIGALYAALRGHSIADTRSMQQYVGAHVWRINQKLKAEGRTHIVTGMARNTYTLSSF